MKNATDPNAHLMEFQEYRLPDGRIVNVDASAAKGAPFIGFTLKGGEIVTAKRVRNDRAGRCVCGKWVVDHFDARNRKLSCDEAKGAK